METGRCWVCKKDRRLAGCYRIRTRPQVRNTPGGWHWACRACLAIKAKENVLNQNDFYELNEMAEVAIVLE